MAPSVAVERLDPDQSYVEVGCPKNINQRSRLTCDQLALSLEFPNQIRSPIKKHQLATRNCVLGRILRRRRRQSILLQLDGPGFKRKMADASFGEASQPTYDRDYGSTPRSELNTWDCPLKSLHERHHRNRTRYWRWSSAAAGERCHEHPGVPWLREKPVCLRRWEQCRVVDALRLFKVAHFQGFVTVVSKLDRTSWCLKNFIKSAQHLQVA